MVSNPPTEKLNPATPPEPSVLARGGLLAYLLLIVYASLYPFTGWHDMGVPLHAYLFAPMPRYWTGFDVVTNIFAYIPLGMLTVYALYPRLRRIPAILLAFALGTLLSGMMEGTQTLLPSRVASNLDLLTNSAGALIGAIIGSQSSHFVLERSRLRRLRRRWFTAQASRGLVVVLLWPLAQIYPQGYLFGNGQILPTLSDWISLLLSTPVDLGDLLRNGAQFSVGQYWLTEALVTGCTMASALLVLLCILRDKAPRMILLMVMLAAALTTKALATALLFTPENTFAWLTPGAQGGLLLGLGILTGTVFLSPLLQRRIAVLLLLCGLIAVNISPDNPYFIATLETWVQGKFLNFDGATQFLSLLWPLFALWFLLHPTHRVKRK